jgi:type VI secretion system protein ImpM
MSTRSTDALWLPSARQPAAAVFGKVAARGDFWSSGQHGPAERAFAGWLTRSVEASGGRIPRGAVRFVASSADGPTLVGCWIASRDAVGRAFPLSVWCRVPADVEDAQQSLLLLHHETFAVAAERAFSSCLECEQDELERARDALVVPHTSALPGLLQQLRGALAGVHVHTFARRNFARWPVASLGYAVAALQRAAALLEPELTLDVPVSSPCDLFAWLELLLGALGGARRWSRILWSPSLGRMLVCLGSPSTQLLAYLDGAEQGSSRRWPLWTETRQAALVARAELDAERARCLDDNGTLSQLIALSRSRS